jgi:uncharacterized protein YvpB
MQKDPEWSSLPYAGGTIGGSGCGPTSMAMAVQTLTGRILTPKEACEWATKKGFAANGNGTYYSYFLAAGREYGLEVAQLNGSDLRNMAAGQARVYHQKAEEAVQNGDLVIACMGKGLWTSSGHFVLWYGFDGTHVYINDPNSTLPERLKNTLQKFESEVKYYFVIKAPEAKALTPQQAIDLVQYKAALADETIEFIHRDNKYGDALAVKLAAAIRAAKGEKREIKIGEAKEIVSERAGLDADTMIYLSRYVYGDQLVAKLAAAML